MATIPASFVVGHQEAIFLEQLELLYGGSKVALVITALVSLFLVFVLWPVINHNVLLIWLTCMLLLACVRAISYRLFQRRSRFSLRLQHWYWIFTSGVLLASTLWASALIWLFPLHDVKHQAFIIFALIGMCSGGVTTLSFRREPALIFIIPILIVLGWRFASQEEAWGISLAMACILYFIGLVISSRHIFKNTLQNIELRLNSAEQSLALEHSEQRLRTIVDTAADAVFLLDEDGRFVDVNQQACQALGYSRQALLQLSISDIELTANKEGEEQTWDGIENGGTITMYGVHRRKDGSTFPVEVRLGVLREGRKKLFSVLARDITERKQVEEALHLSEIQALAQYKGMPLPTYTWRYHANDFTLENYNDAADKFTRGVVKDYLGIKLSVMYADEPEIINDIKMAFDNKTTIEKEVTLYFKHAQVQRHLAMKYAYIPPDMVIIHTEDITDRTNAEQDLRKSEASLAMAQHIAKLGNWDWDLVSGEIQWSAEIFNIFEYDQQTTPANQENFIKAMHPDDLKLMQESEQRAMQGEQYFDEEWRIYTTSGKLKYIHLRGERFFNAEGLPVRMLGTMQDVTERKQAEILKNEFVSTVSHEIRTPLTSIMGSLSIMKGGAVGQFSKEASKMVRIAYDNSRRLLALINDILDIAKIDASGFQLNHETVSLSALVRESAELNAGYVSQYHASIKLGIDEHDNVMIKADKERLMQVMSNLLSNAAKFTEAGDSIDVIIEYNGNKVRVSVIDHGPGIKVEFIPHVFERFTQSDASDTRSAGGTGLGLNISRQIVEAHGGILDFVTGKGGTTFFFEFPVYSE